MDLRSALQALAATPEIQVARFPDFVVVADELALDFDDALLMFRQGSPTLSPQQTAHLQALDTLLHEMSGAANASLWTLAALNTSPEWVTVRTHARELLVAFGWPLDPPPPTDNVYVPGRAT